MAKKKKHKRAAARPAAAPAPSPALPGRPALGYRIGVGLGILLAAICVLYPGLVFENKVFVAGDVEAAASFATPIQKEMAEKRIYPLWNPYLFSGMPSYESLSYLPYVYPVSAFTGFLITKLRFPDFTWLLFHVYLLGVGVFVLLMSRGVHYLIAAAAGVLMMWMPNHVAVGAYGHGSQASAVAYIPFVLLLWDRLWQGKGVVLNASALVILLGLQLLRAHIQISFYTFSLIGLHFLFFGVLKVRDAFRGRPSPPVFGFLRRTFEARPRRGVFLEIGGLAAVLAVIVAGALMVSAVLFLPVREYAHYSIRGASESGGLDYNYATSWSLHPLEALTFVIPYSFGFGKATYHGHMPFTDYPNYVGVIVTLIALTGFFVVKTRFMRFLVFVVVVTTLVSFGKHLPVLYNPLFNYMPYFNKFRVPVMVLIVQQFALVLAFGIGFSALLRVDANKGAKRSLFGAAAAVALLLIVVVSNAYWTDGFARSVAGDIRNVSSPAQQMQLAKMAGDYLFKDLFQLSLFLAAAFTLMLLYYRRVLAATPFVAIFALAAVGDIYRIDRDILYPEKKYGADQLRIIRDKSERDRFLQPDGVINYLKQDGRPYRIFPMHHPQAPTFGDFRNNRYMNFGIGSIGGYHPAKLAIYEDFIASLGPALQRGNLQLVNMLNVRYVLTASPFAENPVFRPLWEGADYRGEKKYIYENTQALPRAFVVDRYEVVPGKRALELLASAQGPDVSEVVLLDKEPPVRPVSDENAQATIVDLGFNEIRISANLPSPAILVLGEIFYPRWKVFIDGTPGEILRANYILRAVALPAGDHEVVFRYDASFLRSSLFVSVAAFGAALLALLFDGLRRVRGGLSASAHRDSDIQ